MFLYPTKLGWIYAVNYSSKIYIYIYISQKWYTSYGKDTSIWDICYITLNNECVSTESK